MSLRPACLAAAMLLALPALAATPVDLVRPLAADGRLSIENAKGEVRVRTWDRPEVHVTGSLGEGVGKLQVGPGGDSLSIEVKYPNGGGWFGTGKRSGPSRIEVRMPAGASLDVDVVSAGVDIEGLAGRRLSVDSVSGPVRVRDSRPGEARFDLVSGDLEADVDSADIAVDTVSGEVRLAGGRGDRLALDTVSGDAELAFESLRRVAMDSVSGDLRVRGALAPGGRLEADTVSGGVRLHLPAASSARLAVETFSGGISSPVGDVKTEKYGPGSRLETRLGDGDGDIRLVTFSGDVKIVIDSN